MSKIRTVFQLMHQMKNWPLFLFDYGVTVLLKRRKLFRYVLRQGMVVNARPFSDDKWTIPEVYTKDDYWHPRFIMDTAKPVIFDVGANIGCFTLHMLSRFPSARLFAIEPTDAVNILKLNVQENNAPHVTVIPAALAASTGEVSFYVDPEHSVFSSSIQTAGNAAGATLKVPAVTLSDLLDTHQVDHIDLLKCDIEGGEYEVFRAMTPGVFARIKNITMEYHQFRPEHKAQELIDILVKNGFELLEEHSINPEIGLIKFRNTSSTTTSG